MIGSARLAPRREVLTDLLPGDRLRDAMVVVGYAGLVGLCAQLVIKLPFTPVPITGQTFAVLFGGMAAGTRRGSAGMLVYLLAGLLGVPWFAAGGGGLSQLSAPSLGYVVGFIPAAALLGWLASRGVDHRPLGVVVALVLANALIYLFGATWLAIRLHLGAAQAISLGVTPFLIGDALKAVVAAGLLPTAWWLVGERRGGSAQ